MASQKIHIANNTHKDIYVVAAPNPHWSVVDIAVDVALLAVGVGEVSAGLAAIRAGGTIKSITQLALCLKNWGAIATGTAVVGSRRVQDVQNISRAVARANEEINKAAIRIPSGEHRCVIEKDWIDMYTQVGGYAGMMGARTVQLLVKDKDGSQAALFCSAPDHSWIATAYGTVVRAQYGRIWVAEPGGRSIEWPSAGAMSLPPADHGTAMTRNDQGSNCPRDHEYDEESYLPPQALWRV